MTKELSLNELKVLAFDIQTEISNKNAQLEVVYKQIRAKMLEENETQLPQEDKKEEDK